MALTADDYRLVLYCVVEENEDRRRGKLGDVRRTEKLIAKIVDELAEMARKRQPEAADLRPLTHDDDALGSREVAALLGTSVRTVQRRADELGGQLVGHSYVFSRSTIREHIAGCAA
jgi:hypothetical protein